MRRVTNDSQELFNLSPPEPTGPEAAYDTDFNM